MIIAATPQDATLDARRSRRWQRYSETLRAMTGRAYEDAEHEAWDTLQAELARHRRTGDASTTRSDRGPSRLRQRAAALG